MSASLSFEFGANLATPYDVYVYLRTDCLVDADLGGRFVSDT